jgi:cystathionine beta-lyase/cystathionine gamma-synthase
MKTLIYICKTQNEFLKIAKACFKNNISFEFMNENEIYFAIYDNLDFIHKVNSLGDEIINLKNIAN